MQATAGNTGKRAQQGLKPGLVAQGYFLPCVCVPEEDLEVAAPGEGVIARVEAVVVQKVPLNREIIRLRLRCQGRFPHRAGQFVHLRRNDGLVRSYSIASVPSADEDPEIDLHVRRLAGGAMTEWIHDSLDAGDSLEIAGPAGDCWYAGEDPEQPMLLIGTGSGLAPLWGIVQDAVDRGHTGPIRLYHGSWRAEGLYLVEELRQLVREVAGFEYHPCVDAFDGEPLEGYRLGRADQVALDDNPQLKGWRVYLCGHPDLVAATRKKAFLAGASMREIFADPFVLSKPR